MTLTKFKEAIEIIEHYSFAVGWAKRECAERRAVLKLVKRLQEADKEVSS